MIMKKMIAVLLILCLCPLGALAETAADLDDGDIAGLYQAIFEANREEALFSRHESIAYKVYNPDAPDSYDVIWETAEQYYQSFGEAFAVWARDQVYYMMNWDPEAGGFYLTCGYDYDRCYNIFCFAGDSAEDIFNPEHERLTDRFEEDGRLYLITEYDETLSLETLEGMGREYAGQSVKSKLVMDAETNEIVEYYQYVTEDGEDTVIYYMAMSYDQPEPFACRVLRAAFERDARNTMNMTYLIDPGTDHETVRTLTLPANTDCRFSAVTTPYVYFYDPDCTRMSGWDGMSDLTVYIYTNPSDELTEKFMALYNATESNQE